MPVGEEESEMKQDGVKGTAEKGGGGNTAVEGKRCGKRGRER